MTLPIHIIFQDEIIRGHNIAKAARATGSPVTRIDLSHWRDQVKSLDVQIRESGARTMIFCALPVAGYIKRFCPTLARGITLPDPFLKHHNYSALLPAGMQLNTKGIYLPWGRIPEMASMLSHIYPDGVFIRPDSPLKPFTGFSVCHDELLQEHMMMTQAANIHASELCFLAEKQRLPDCEYRVWIVDSVPVTSASYGWNNTSEGHTAPESVLDASRRLGQSLELHEQIYTADFLILHDQVKVVELNAVSTSGWYQGMDPVALLTNLDPMFV